MEEKNQNVSVDTEELKKETVNTVNQVKDSIKNVNIKEETKATKGFITEMFKNPLEKIKEIANDTNNKYFKTALFIVIVWTAAVLLKTTWSTIYISGFARIFRNILSILKVILAPVCGIIVYSLIVFLMNKKSKKSLVTTLTTITTAQIPLAISSVVSLLTLISSNITKLTSPFYNICYVISIVLSYFAMKDLFGEEQNKEFVKKFALIQVIYYIAYIVISYFGIYI